MSLLLHKPIVYCISEGRADDDNFHLVKEDIVPKIGNAASRGVSMFQIREKKLSAARQFELAEEAVRAAGETGLKIIVNGRADIALAAGAAGVHLPADGVSAGHLRKCVPEDFIIGVSTHSVEETVAAMDDGADFVTFGPVFASPGKGRGVGLNYLAEVCATVAPFPVVALGGIDQGRIEVVFRNGASGFAAIRYLNGLLETVGKTDSGPARVL